MATTNPRLAVFNHVYHLRQQRNFFALVPFLTFLPKTTDDLKNDKITTFDVTGFLDHKIKPGTTKGLMVGEKFTITLIVYDTKKGDFTVDNVMPIIESAVYINIIIKFDRIKFQSNCYWDEEDGYKKIYGALRLYHDRLEQKINPKTHHSIIGLKNAVHDCIQVFASAMAILEQ